MSQAFIAQLKCEYNKHPNLPGTVIPKTDAFCNKIILETLALKKAMGIESMYVSCDVQKGIITDIIPSGTEMRQLGQMIIVKDFAKTARDMYHFGMKDFEEWNEKGEHDWGTYMGELGSEEVKMKEESTARYAHFLRCALTDTLKLYGSHTQGHRIDTRGKVSDIKKELAAYYEKGYNISPFLMRSLGRENVVEALKPDVDEAPFTPLCWNPGKVVLDKDSKKTRPRAPKQIRECIYRETDKRKSVEAQERGKKSIVAKRQKKAAKCSGGSSATEGSSSSGDAGSSGSSGGGGSSATEGSSSSGDAGSSASSGGGGSSGSSGGST